jgi:hypothetical protein
VTLHTLPALTEQTKQKQKTKKTKEKTSKQNISYGLRRLPPAPCQIQAVG